MYLLTWSIFHLLYHPPWNLIIPQFLNCKNRNWKQNGEIRHLGGKKSREGKLTLPCETDNVNSKEIKNFGHILNEILIPGI